MGLFDWFSKAKPTAATPPPTMSTVPLPQLCYDVAYFILPHYAFGEWDKLAELCLKSPIAAGPFFYVMAAQARQTEPIVEDAKQFRWHHGQLSDGREYLALEYPVPPPIDFSVTSIDNMVAGSAAFVLAPHFSAIVRGSDEVQYFVLGQTPVGGGTTLRCVLPEGANCNLGRGPQPTLAAFLEAIQERATRK